MASDPSRAFGFGQRLQAARVNKKLTGVQFGKGLQGEDKDASKQTVSDWENERHLPDVWQLREICLRLGVSADYLLFGDKGMTPAMLEAHAALQKLAPEQRRELLAIPTQDSAAKAYRAALEKSTPRRKASAKRTKKKPKNSD
jgi:transcriptional regulator with XRE-family HTH domain